MFKHEPYITCNRCGRSRHAGVDDGDEDGPIICIIGPSYQACQTGTCMPKKANKNEASKKKAGEEDEVSSGWSKT